MGRPKKLKAKEPIRLRSRKIANGNRTLYLDFYDGGQRHYEYLKLYLVPEVDNEAKALNANTLNVANAIKAQRIMDIANGKGGITKKARPAKMLLFDWIDYFKASNDKNGKSKSYSKTLGQLKRMLDEYGAAKTLLEKVNKDFCSGFLVFLNNYESRYGRPLSRFTVYLYYQCFVVALNAAVDAGRLEKNPCHEVKEKPKDPESTRTYLTVDEVKALIKTDCFREDVKQAFLFACFCGLRYSDISLLTWGDVKTEGEQKRARIMMKKTGNFVDVIFSTAAQAWMPPRGDKGDADLVFDLPSHARISKIVKKWAENAGITKYVTFHTSRHTFATMTLNEGGASLYTVSKLLGHKDVKTTQIYAEVLEKEKKRAVDMIAGLFD